MTFSDALIKFLSDEYGYAQVSVVLRSRCSSADSSVHVETETQTKSDNTFISES